MIFQMILTKFLGDPKEAVFDAAVEAVKSLGHEVESVTPPGADREVTFRANVRGRRDSKGWTVRVGDDPSGVTTAAVTRSAFIGGRRKVSVVGQEIFRSMDTILHGASESTPSRATARRTVGLFRSRR